MYNFYSSNILYIMFISYGEYMQDGTLRPGQNQKSSGNVDWSMVDA